MRKLFILFLFLSCSSHKTTLTNSKSSVNFNTISFDYDKFISETSFIVRDSQKKVNLDFIKSCRSNKSDYVVSYDCKDVLFPVDIAISKANPRYFYLVQRNVRLLFYIEEDGSVEVGLDDPVVKIITKEIVFDLIQKKLNPKNFTIKNLNWSEEGYYQVVINDEGNLELYTRDLENTEVSNRKIADLIWSGEVISIGIENEK